MLLKELCTVSSNNYQKKDNWNKFNYLDTGSLIKNNIIEIQTFNNEKDLPSRAKQKVKKGNILYSSVRPNQEHYGYIDKDYDNLLVSTGFIILIPNEKLINPKYLYYYLAQDIITNQMQSIAQNSTSAYPSITKDDLLNIEIDLPNRKTQDKIVEILSNIDNQIERNNCMVKRLQDLGNTTFSSYFKDCKNIISFTEFPYFEVLKPSINKFNHTKHYIATAEVDGINLNFDAPLITYENRESRANMQPIKNSIWFAKLKNSIKHIYVPNNDMIFTNDYIFSTGFCGIKCDEIAYEFLIGFIESPYFEIMKDKLTHGATMESVNNDDLASINIPFPTKDMLEKYHFKTKNIYEQISILQVENHKLNQLKSKLLPLLINGQLEV